MLLSYTAPPNTPPIHLQYTPNTHQYTPNTHQYTPPPTHTVQAGLNTVIKEGALSVSIYYLECLAQATYLIQHKNKALIVDPRRDIDAYLQVGGAYLW